MYISFSFLPRYRQLDDLDPLTHQVQVQVFTGVFTQYGRRVRVGVSVKIRVRFRFMCRGSDV